MARPAKSVAVINDFAGLITQTDADDLRQGAGQTQTNVCVVRMGEMQVRQGYRKVTFETE